MTHSASAERLGKLPVQSRAQETRSRILQHARNAFAEQGFGAANVRDIAQRAGTTHSMITYHFGTKDQLWRESVRDMFAHLETTVLDVGREAAAAGLSLRDQFSLMVRAYVHYCAEHPEHARITIMESIHGGERFTWMVREFVALNHRAGQDSFAQMVGEKLLPDMPFASYVYAMAGMTQLPFVLSREAKESLDYDFMSGAAIERHADAIIAMLLKQSSVS